MEDIEKKLELMQKEIDVLGGCVKAQICTINTLLEIVQSLKQYLSPDIQIPDNIVYSNPKDCENKKSLIEAEINEFKKDTIGYMSKLTHCIQYLMDCFRLLDAQMNKSPAERRSLFNELEPEYMQKYYEMTQGIGKTIYTAKDKDGKLVKVTKSNFGELIEP